MSKTKTTKPPKVSDAQKWIFHWINDGFNLTRITDTDYVYVEKHPWEYRVSVATLRSLVDKGLIEQVHKNDLRIYFDMTQTARDLWAAGLLQPTMRKP